jgi:hypothetical protein
VTALARTALLPFDHLAAELTAFPLSSEQALTWAVTRLDPAMSDRTAGLWQAAEQRMVASAPGMTLDELTALRDQCWFADLGADDAVVRPNVGNLDAEIVGRPLHRLLAAVTRDHLQQLGEEPGRSAPFRDVGPETSSAGYAQARRAWMWLTFALPADLLLATCADDGWIPEPTLITAPVRDLLSRGFAETHLHAGAALDFPTIWSAMMARLATPGLPDRELAAPGAVLDEGTRLVSAVLHAAVGRTLLAHHLEWGGGATFLDFLNGPFRDEFVPYAGAANFALLTRAMHDLRSGRFSSLDLAQLRGAYVELVGSRASHRIHDPARLALLDPIVEILPSGRGTAEQRLVIGMTADIDRRSAAGTVDVDAERVFWQAVRVRALIYRHVTQRPLTPGLPWFIRFYDRMRKARGPLSPRAIVRASATTSGIQDGLRSLEVRTKPDAEAAEMSRWTSAVRNQAAAYRRSGTEVGLVYHFLKTRGGELPPGVMAVHGTGTHADPLSARNNGRCRYAHFYDREMPGAQTLANRLYRLPFTQYLVRGLDVCADELAVPTWVLHPLLDHVRRAAAVGARRLPLHRTEPPPPLRTTVHAGEDFAHLLTGLRHVHEAVDVLNLREGDRIGHGMALGIDPAGWARRIGRVAMPLQDRVLDMAWEWDWWARRGGGTDAGRLAFLAHSTADLARRWFCDPVRSDDPLHSVDVRSVQRLRSTLADLDGLTSSGFPGPGPADDPIVERYLRDPETFRRGMQIVTVNPAGEIDAMTRIATSLRNEISRRAIAIEINPTSNLLVGDLSNLADHPLWRLSPPRPNTDLPPLAVTVGSDDPVVFNCRLPLEYQLLYDALILAGLTDLEAMEWLERVRRTGLERRFTLPVDRETLAALDRDLGGDPPPPRIISRV